MAHGEDEIASTELIAVRPTGERVRVRIALQKPYLTEDEAWSCMVSGAPLLQFPRIGVHGSDSLQALALAIWLVRDQLKEFVAGGGQLSYADAADDDVVDLDVMFGRSSEP